MSRTTLQPSRRARTAATDPGLPRAGLREKPAARPRPIFEIVETSVLVLVAALAMTTIIVSTDTGVSEAHAAPAPTQERAAVASTR